MVGEHPRSEATPTRLPPTQIWGYGNKVKTQKFHHKQSFQHLNMNFLVGHGDILALKLTDTTTRHPKTQRDTTTSLRGTQQSLSESCKKLELMWVFMKAVPGRGTRQRPQSHRNEPCQQTQQISRQLHPKGDLLLFYVSFLR